MEGKFGRAGSEDSGKYNAQTGGGGFLGRDFVEAVGETGTESADRLRSNVGRIWHSVAPALKVPGGDRLPVPATGGMKFMQRAGPVAW